LVRSKSIGSNVRFAFRSFPSSSSTLRFDHSTTNRRLGAAPIVFVVVVAAGGIIRSSQYGAINEGGTVPTLPLARTTVREGNAAFCHSDTERGSRLSAPSA